MSHDLSICKYLIKVLIRASTLKVPCRIVIILKNFCMENNTSRRKEKFTIGRF